MATLTDVVGELGRKFEMAAQRVGDDEFNVVVRFADGRSQAVNVFVDDDLTGETWVVARSPIGDVEELDPIELLERNAAVGYPFVAVSDGQAFVCAQLPAAIVTVDLCQRMLMDVAVFADSLEEELVGGDER